MRLQALGVMYRFEIGLATHILAHFKVDFPVKILHDYFSQRLRRPCEEEGTWNSLSLLDVGSLHLPTTHNERLTRFLTGHVTRATLFSSTPIHDRSSIHHLLKLSWYLQAWVQFAHKGAHKEVSCSNTGIITLRSLSSTRLHLHCVLTVHGIHFQVSEIPPNAGIWVRGRFFNHSFCLLHSFLRESLTNRRTRFVQWGVSHQTSHSRRPPHMSG